ncbi:MAG: hypothetical protein L0332_35945 [Chloroflexi bacterium]|nr:hypothetical protein [Chloroflexota bacterium]MCI0580443.1 hypothetical protein [Chloroflexota bacterium]MCI0649187.1 hypothetical protein [Chloroflexota bacterium]MCI0732090.1 hypothetical protein [Chloroflexota bacterium]
MSTLANWSSGRTASSAQSPDAASCPPTDQRGVPRPQGDGCDIGAFEFSIPTAVALTRFDGQAAWPGWALLALPPALAGLGLFAFKRFSARRKSL